MSGILNQKNRIFDVILTDEGKRQLSEGTLRINYYSFSDSSATYHRDTIISGGLSETHRFILEASDNPYDQITFEASDAGLLSSFVISGSEKYSIINGQIFSGSLENKRIPITGSAFSSTANNLLSSSIDAFKKQLILKSPEFVEDIEKKFILGNNKATFQITNEQPFKPYQATKVNINHIESFFQDKRLSHIPNFMFLPPKNKATSRNLYGSELGEYINVKQSDIVTKNDLDNELKQYKKIGYEKQISFLDTSTENNIMAQMFEISDGAVRKLDIIDFGEFEESKEHVFFVGKVFIDDLKAQTFVHMFTIVFSGD
jgi:hypothetical protein